MIEKAKYAVLIPTYNNEKTLEKLIRGVLEVCSDVIVVNDGSTDSTSEILKKISGITLVEYKANQGKGHALRQGILMAGELGFEHVITIDSDGQHRPENIPDLAENLVSGEEVVLMGNRNMDQEGIPKKSSFGNKFSSFWFWAETGIKLQDTQTGFRAYPVKTVNAMRWFTSRFEFEIEIIVRLAWKMIPVKEVPVDVIYPEDRVTHFKPLKDFLRISALNTVLFTLALLWYLPKLLLFGKGESSVKSRLKREFSKNKDEPLKLAASVGLGLFFGVFPIWGFQMMAGFFVASLLKLNRIVVLAVSNISIPPMIPLIIYFSFLFGKPFVTNGVNFPSFEGLSLETVEYQLTQYLVGACLLSVSLGIIGFLITYLTLKVAKKE
ncbi:MAG: DUF2062 domain-containing protein [Schleiferiaceae bacterium]|nr:DUF2062 domain-containing protein [Schleiferiaceae bacterium]